MNWHLGWGCTEMKNRNKSIIQAYREFYESFGLIARAYGFYPYKLEFADETLGNGYRRARLKKPIFLSEWPVSKSTDQYQHVDILVDANFQYLQNDFLHTRSSVYLAYFKRDKQKSVIEAFENLRFDFHPEVGDIDHPLLHAHVFSKGKPDLEPAPLPKNYTIDWSFLDKRVLNALRLPIPNMTLPSVLCSLVACHLGVLKLRDLLARTAEIRKAFPSLAISKEQGQLFFHNSMAGSQWFERA